jgi:mRNA-degrading endonuclease RelE of RelBE toxin-antitoxin system
MKYSILSSDSFDRKLKRLAKKYASIKEDVGDLVKQLYDNPQLGTSIGSNCFKIRMGITSKGKGKSGGARVITYVIHLQNTIYLLDIYDKSEQEDITEKQLKALIESIL